MITDPITFTPQDIKRITNKETLELRALGYEWCPRCKITIKSPDFGSGDICKKCTTIRDRKKKEAARQSYIEEQGLLIANDPLYWDKFIPEGKNLSKRQSQLLKKYNMRRCFNCSKTKNLAEFDKGGNMVCKICRRVSSGKQRLSGPSLSIELARIQENYINDLKTKVVNCQDFWNNFNIKISRIRPYEQDFLTRHNKKWCPRCKKARDLDQFSNQKYCLCRLKFKPKNINREAKNAASRKYASKNRKKISEKQKAKRNESPESKLHHNISNSIRELLKENGKIKCRRTLEYMGLKNDIELINILSAKTTNHNWVNEGYDVDHIWQVNWFSRALSEGRAGIIEVLYRHQNLRPLPASVNRSRSRTDFLPLVKEDLEIYRPFLNPDILLLIEAYFAQEKS